MLPIFLLIFLFLTPESSYAWGPLTHTYLSQQLFSLYHLIPLPVFHIINKYREYFVYGNIIPDMVIGKKYLSLQKNPHTWETGLNLFRKAKTPEEKSFAYGFLTHLAADAILHYEIKDLNPFQHAIFELKADRIIDRVYWFQLVTINKKVKKTTERFLDQTVIEPAASLKTSRKIYKSLIFLSVLNKGELKNPEIFDILHLKSLTAMLEVLNDDEKAEIVNLPTHN